MSDIVKRLRHHRSMKGGSLYSEAANEIERLRAVAENLARVAAERVSAVHKNYAEEIPKMVDRVKREARVEGMQAARAVVAARHMGDNTREDLEVMRCVEAIAALIAAEERITEAPPGPTLIDTHGLPDDEGDDWDIRAGKPREADEIERLRAERDELKDAISGRTFSVDEGREWKAKAEAAEARVKELEAALRIYDRTLLGIERVGYASRLANTTKAMADAAKAARAKVRAMKKGEKK